MSKYEKYLRKTLRNVISWNASSLWHLYSTKVHQKDGSSLSLGEQLRRRAGSTNKKISTTLPFGCSIVFRTSFFRIRSFSSCLLSTLALFPITGEFLIEAAILLDSEFLIFSSLFLGVHHFITCIHGDWKNCTTYRWILELCKSCKTVREQQNFLEKCFCKY